MSQGSNGNGGGGGGKATSKLVEGLQSLAGALVDRAMDRVNERVGGLTEQLTGYASGGSGPGQAALAKGLEEMKGGGSPVKAVVGAGVAGGKEQVKQAFGGGGGGGDDDKGSKNDLKVTNIVESIEVGVPVSVAYNQWTEFKQFPSFMKKVEDIDQESPEKMKWKAQVFWSHRTWESTIIEQVPDERIVWKSKGDKGSVDGTVTFHEVTPDLTRILVVLEYHPQGFVERTGNIWRAPGRRARLEMKHFVRHVMRDTILNPDEVHGWRGEIRDGEVVQEDPRDEEGEQAEGDEDQEEPAATDEADDDGEDEDESDEDEADEDEADEDEAPQAARKAAKKAAPRKRAPKKAGARVRASS